MSDQVSVRLAVVGGSQFRNEVRQAGAEGARSMQQIQTASRGASPAIQQVALQASTMFGTMAGGSSAVGGLAAGLANAAMAGGAFGIAGAVVLTVLGSMVTLLGQGGKNAADMASEMTNLQGSTGAVSGAVSALESVQRQYTAAIEGSKGASGTAAAAVVANSKAEFEARKQVLAVELELLRIRGAEQATDLRNLEDQFRMEGQRALDSGRNLSAYTGDEAAEAAFRQAGVQRPRGEAQRQVDDFLKRNEQTTLAMRKLRAEAVLTNLTIKQTEEALGTTFQDIGSGAAGKDPGKGTGAGKSGAGAGGAVNKSVEEGKRVFEQTRTAAERYAAELARLNELLRVGAIDQDTYNRAVGRLKEEAERAKGAMDGLNYVSQQAGNSLIDAMMGGKNAGEQLIRTLQRAILEATILGQGPLAQLFGTAPKAGGAGGALLGGLFGAIFGGKREAGGPVQAGKAYLVGEKRPELFVPGVSGTILPDVGRAAGGKQASAGGGQISIGFDASINAFVAVMTDRMGRVVAEATPAIIGQARQSTLASMNRTKAGWG
ncbi:hypothetical protein [Nostoc phage Nsp-JY21]